MQPTALRALNKLYFTIQVDTKVDDAVRIFGGPHPRDEIFVNDL